MKFASLHLSGLAILYGEASGSLLKGKTVTTNAGTDIGDISNVTDGMHHFEDQKKITQDGIVIINWDWTDDCWVSTPASGQNNHVTIDIGSSALVATVFVLTTEDSINYADIDPSILTVGDTLDPEDGEFCADVTETGWYNCAKQLTGRYLHLQQQRASTLRLCEIQAYSYPYITHNGIGESSVGSLYAGYTPAQLMVDNPMSLTERVSRNYNSVEKIDDNGPWMCIQNTEPMEVKQVVAFETSGFPEEAIGVSVYVSDQDGNSQPGSKACEGEAQKNLLFDTDFECNLTGEYVCAVIKSASNYLSLASFGILAECDCSTTAWTTVDTNMPDLLNDVPKRIEVTAYFGKSPDQYLSGMDSVSWKCDRVKLYCGPRDIRFFDDGVPVDLLTHPFIWFFKDSDYNLFIQSDNINDVGVHEIKIEWYLEYYPSITPHVQTIEVEIKNPCFQGRIDVSDESKEFYAVRPSQINYVILYDASTEFITSTYGYGDYICGPWYYSFDFDAATPKVQSTVTLDQTGTTGEELYFFTPTLDDVGTYKVPMTLAFVDYPDVKWSATLDLEILNPCPETIYDIFPDQIMTVSPFMGEVTLDLVPPENDESRHNGGDGYALCGPTEFTIVGDNFPDGVRLDFDKVNNRITVESNDASHKSGDDGYTIALSLNLVEYPLVTQTGEIKVYIVDPCDTSVMEEFTIEPITVTTFDEELKFELPPVFDSISLANNGDGTTACGNRQYEIMADTYIPEPWPPTVTITSDQVNGWGDQFTFQSTDKLDYTQEYKVDIKAYLWNYKENSTPSFSTMTVKVVNPCFESRFNPINDVDMLATVAGPVVTHTMTGVTDKESFLNGGDGLTHCGARRYEIKTYPSNWPATLTLDLNGNNNEVFEVESNAAADDEFAPYTVIMTAILADYPDVKRDFKLNVGIINPCGGTVLEEVDDVIIKVRTFDVTQKAVFAITGDSISIDTGDGSGTDVCGARRFSLGSYSDWPPSLTIKQQGIYGEEFIVESTGMFDYQATDYRVEVTLKLDLYQVETPAWLIVEVENPCTTSVLDDLPDVTMTVATFATPTELRLNIVEDSASRINGGNGFDHCGLRTFSLGTPTESWPESVKLTQLSDGSLLSLRSSDYSDVDRSPLEVPYFLTLDDYDQVFTSALIEVIIEDPCPGTELDKMLPFQISVITFDQAETYTANLPEDIISKRNMGDGYTSCGARTITMEDPLVPWPSGILVSQSPGSGETFTVISTMKEDEGDHVRDITVTLDKYPGISVTTQMTVKVTNPCYTSFFDKFSGFEMTAYVFEPATEFTLDLIQDSVSKLNGGNGLEHCGPRIYSRETPVVPWPTSVVLDQKGDSLETFMLSSTAVSDAQYSPYKVTITVSLQDYPDVKKSATLTAHVKDPCTSTVFDDFVVDPIEVTSFDAPAVVSLDLVKDSASSISGRDGFITCGARHFELATVLWPYTVDIDLSGTYEETITVSSTGKNDYMTDYTVDICIVLDLYPLVNRCKELQVIVTNPCFKSQLDPLDDFGLSTVIFETPTVTTLPQSEDSASRINGGDGMTHCGARMFELLPPDDKWPDSLFLFTAGNANEILTLQSSDFVDDDESPYTREIVQYLFDYPDVKTSTFITVTIGDPCENTVLETFSLDPMTIVTFDAAQEQEVPIAKDSISRNNGGNGLEACGGRTLTYTTQGWPASLTLTQTGDSQEVIWIQSSADTDKDNSPYYVDLTWTMDKYPLLAITTTLEVNVIDPCENTKFDAFNPMELEIPTYASATVLPLDLLKDSASKLNGGDGVTHCGDRKYTITKIDTWPFTVVDSQSGQYGEILSFSSSDISDVLSSPLLLEIKVELVNYPQHVATTTLELVIVDPCYGTIFDPFPDIYVTITTFDAPYVLTLDFIADSISKLNGGNGFDDCGAREFTLNDYNWPASIDLQRSGTYGEILTLQSLEYGDHERSPRQAVIFQTLVEYNTVSTATILHVIVQDPCETTELIPLDPIVMETITNYPPAEFTVVLPQDKVSQIDGGDGYYYCGERKCSFTQDGSWPDTVTLQTLGFYGDTLSLRSLGMEDYLNVYLGTLTCELVNYPVSTSVQVTANVLACITRLGPEKNVDGKVITYFLTDEEQRFDYHYKQYPNCNYDQTTELSTDSNIPGIMIDPLAFNVNKADIVVYETDPDNVEWETTVTMKTYLIDDPTIEYEEDFLVYMINLEFGWQTVQDFEYELGSARQSYTFQHGEIKPAEAIAAGYNLRTDLDYRDKFGNILYTLPDFVEYDDRTGDFVIYTNDPEFAGEHEFEFLEQLYIGTEPYEPEKYRLTKFKVIIPYEFSEEERIRQEYDFKWFKGDPPYFDGYIHPMVAECDEPAIFTLPEIKDKQEDFKEIKWTFKEAGSFMKYMVTQNALVIHANQTSERDIGHYYITANLTDKRNNSQAYNLEVEIICSRYDPNAKPLPPPEPFVKITNVSQTGLVTLKFDYEMQAIDDYERIYQDQFLVNGERRHVLDLDMLYNQHSDKRIHLDWHVADFNNDTLLIQLDFWDPFMVSHYESKESLRITLNGLFETSNGTALPPDTVLVWDELPSQIDEWESKAAKTLGQTVFWLTVGTLVVSMVGGIALKGSSSTGLVSFTKFLQITSHIMLVNLLLPDNMLQFFHPTLEVSAFEFVDVSPAYEWLFPPKTETSQERLLQGTFDLYRENDKLLESAVITSDGASGEYHSENFNELGYKTKGFLLNAGCIGVVLLLFPLAVLLLWLFKKLPVDPIKEGASQCWDFIFWKGVLCYLDFSYLIIAICVLLNTVNNEFLLEWDHRKPLTKINTLMSILLFAFVFLAPVVQIFEHLRRFEDFKESRQMAKKYGYFLSNLKYMKKGSVVVCYIAFSSVRRLWLAVTLVFFQNWPFWTAFTVHGLVFWMLILISLLMPYKSTGEHRITVYNESICLHITYLLLVFTDWVRDGRTKHYVGWYIIIICLLTTLTNVGFQLKSKIRLLWLTYLKLIGLRARQRRIDDAAKDKYRLESLRDDSGIVNTQTGILLSQHSVVGKEKLTNGLEPVSEQPSDKENDALGEHSSSIKESDLDSEEARIMKAIAKNRKFLQEPRFKIRSMSDDGGGDPNSGGDEQYFHSNTLGNDTSAVMPKKQKKPRKLTQLELKFKRPDNSTSITPQATSANFYQHRQPQQNEHPQKYVSSKTMSRKPYGQRDDENDHSIFKYAPGQDTNGMLRSSTEYAKNGVFKGATRHEEFKIGQMDFEDDPGEYGMFGMDQRRATAAPSVNETGGPFDSKKQSLNTSNPVTNDDHDEIMIGEDPSESSDPEWKTSLVKDSYSPPIKKGVTVLNKSSKLMDAFNGSSVQSSIQNRNSSDNNQEPEESSVSEPEDWIEVFEVEAKRKGGLRPDNGLITAAKAKIVEPEESDHDVGW